MVKQKNIIKISRKGYKNKHKTDKEIFQENKKQKKRIEKKYI